MSHNITMKGVRFTDLDLLGNIVANLSQGAANLVRDQKTFRTYAGQSTTCDHCIKMPGKHDIGLVADKEGGYTLKFDPYNMSPIFSAGHERIGKLVQEYALQNAEIAAAQNGWQTERKQGANNSVVLEVVRSVA